jgi:hypothetical protein
MFCIHSVNSDRELVFSDNTGDCFQIELHGSELNSKISIWHDDSFSGLGEFFKVLAQSAKPWDDERKWVSLEGDFSITSVCSRTGSVMFTIEIHQQTGNDEEAFIRAGLTSEFGQLDTIARDAVRFFER